MYKECEMNHFALQAVTLPKIIREGMGGPEPLEVLKSRDYVLVYR